MKFVIQWILGPLCGSALLGLAWLAYNDVPLYENLSGNARNIAYVILWVAGMIRLGILTADTTSLFRDIDRLDETKDCEAEVQRLASEVKDALAYCGQIIAWFGAVFLFFLILDGIADHRIEALDARVSRTTAPESPQN